MKLCEVISTTLKFTDDSSNENSIVMVEADAAGIAGGSNRISSSSGGAVYPSSNTNDSTICKGYSTAMERGEIGGEKDLLQPAHPFQS